MLRGSNDIAAASRSINSLSDLVENEGKLIPAVESLGSRLVKVVDDALELLEESSNKEVKHTYRARAAGHDLVLVVERAGAFLDRVSDVIYFCQSNSMEAVKDGLRRSPPDLKPLRDLMALMGNSLTNAERKIKCTLDDVSRAAIQSCTTAAEICASEERASRERRRAAVAVGRLAVLAMVVVVCIIVLVSIPGYFETNAGVFRNIVPFGICCICAAVWGAVFTPHIAIDYRKTEISYLSIYGDFDSLLNDTHRLKETLAQVHGVEEDIVSQINSISCCMDKDTNVDLIRDAVGRFNKVCTTSYSRISRCKQIMEHKIEELQAKLQHQS